ncbi:hypothetical protein [Brevibacillus laterosporus]|uniref:hypothetical protein n=1 Tax=Brevibacillus laterosporus TaxID=1465 RepID=UPI0011402DFC|nr:hypothetical protein [Brevibacillus laterosporus]
MKLKKKKKGGTFMKLVPVFSVLSALALTTVLISPNVTLARTENSVDVNKRIEQLIDSSDGMDANTFLEKLVEKRSQIEPDPESTEKGLVIAEEIDNINDELGTDKTRSKRSASKYDKNTAKLRAGNMIELTLNADEGLSSRDITTIYSAANEARDLAKEKFSRNVGWEDAYRHFAWNHIAAKKIGIADTRIATNNHEWGLLLIDPVLNYHEKRYKHYKDKGNGNGNAANKALGDTVNEIPYLKKNLIRVFDRDFNTFRKFVPDATIMDWNNNDYGRAYAAKYPDLETALKKAKDYLITDENSVSKSEYKKVWKNNWYKN